jgi:hypothetical protein
VVALLERCEALDPDLVEAVTHTLISVAQSGVRSGIVGQPTVRDAKALAHATRVLDSLSMLSPAYRLFETLRDLAQSHIERARQDAEELDER